jgi:Leucine-rich repeat (LRR) protein
MKLFGLLSLVLALAVSAWVYSNSIANISTGDDVSLERQDIPDILESAQNAAQQLGSTGPSVSIYDGISVANNTTLVDLSGRGLTGSLKAEVGQLSNLRTLDISNNNFTGLPAEIGQLKQLEILNVANNPLTGLPNELANLQNLRTLDLQGTQYSEQDLAVIKAGLPATTVILK